MGIFTNIFRLEYYLLIKAGNEKKATQRVTTKIFYSWTESGKILPKLQNKIILYNQTPFSDRIGFFFRQDTVLLDARRMSLMDYPDVKQILNRDGNPMVFCP